MKFDISQYTGKCAMHCSTEEDAQTFLAFLKKLGKAWCNGESYAHIHYNDYEEHTGYSFNEGKYGTVSWYRDHNYTVLEFEDFEWDDDITPPSSRDLQRLDNFFAQFAVIQL